MPPFRSYVQKMDIDLGEEKLPPLPPSPLMPLWCYSCMMHKDSLIKNQLIVMQALSKEAGKNVGYFLIVI